jgi:hypothetical protein
MTHEGPRHINVVDCVIANAISPGPGTSQGLNAEDAEDISSLYLEVKILFELLFQDVEDIKCR